MEIKFEYGINFEFDRVKSVLKKIDWYNSQGYDIKLPNGTNDKSSDEEIRDQIRKEFKEEDYLNIIKEINLDISKIKEQLSSRLGEIFGENVPENFLIYLTNYGSGGSYNLPNKVIFNIKNIRGLKTIIHEIIHLLIEDLIQKYNVQHWEKELIVDLILNSEKFDFLNYNTWQGEYNGAKRYIGKLFNSYFFKNMEMFFSKIDSVRNID